FLIQEGIIKVPATAQDTSGESSGIPSWIKMNAGWWADGSIDDDSFIQGIQFLIQLGIIQIPDSGN
ncbi:MAG: peptidase, partial [Thaumarchaeota archaeon]|nr:peptidase [Nitrososphaerota archaeon]